MQRVTDLADPRRCKGASVDGQCQNVAEEGAEYCRVHGGKDQAPARRLKQYLLTKAQDRERLAQFAENDGAQDAAGRGGRRPGAVGTAAESCQQVGRRVPCRLSRGREIAEATGRIEEIQLFTGTKVWRNAFAGAELRVRPADHRDHRGRVGGNCGLRADRREHHHANPGDGPTHRQL